MEELSYQWKNPISVSVHKDVDKTDRSNYSGISLLSISYKNVSSILSKLSQYIDKVIRDQRGFDVTDLSDILYSSY
jgi:hypothetical protein